MEKLKNTRPGFYSALNFLNIIISLCIIACTQRSESNSKHSQADGMKYSAKSSNSAVEKGQPLISVASIQKAYSDIVSKATRGNLDSTSFKYSCHGEKGGKVIYFTEKGQLRLIVHRYNEYDHYSAEDRYFVTDSTLFFILTNSVSWAFESGPEGATKDNIQERRVYLVNNKPIKCLEKKFVIRSQEKDNPRPETVTSREVDCSSPEAVMKPYVLLNKYRSNPTSGCLD
jgi:hypothetical protein